MVLRRYDPEEDERAGEEDRVDDAINAFWREIDWIIRKCEELFFGK
jgi:hypothetical protein